MWPVAAVLLGLLPAAAVAQAPPAQPPLVPTAGLPPWPSDCSTGPTFLGCFHDHDPTFENKEFVGPRILTYGVPGCSGCPAIAVG